MYVEAWCKQIDVIATVQYDHQNTTARGRRNSTLQSKVPSFGVRLFAIFPADVDLVGLFLALYYDAWVIGGLPVLGILQSCKIFAEVNSFGSYFRSHLPLAIDTVLELGYLLPLAAPPW